METAHTQQGVISLKDWMITILIAAIPIVGFIMLFIWGFGDGTHPTKANWAKATLLWILIAFVFYGIIAVLFGMTILAAMGG